MTSQGVWALTDDECEAIVWALVNGKPGISTEELEDGLASANTVKVNWECWKMAMDKKVKPIWDAEAGEVKWWIND